MREWLTVIVVLLIAGILLDGLRRMRIARRQNIKMSRQAAVLDDLVEPDVEVPLTSEFPSGGARVAAVRDDSDVSDILQNVRQKHVLSRQTRGVRKNEEDAPKTLDSLPNLMNAFVKRTQARPVDDEPLVGSLANIDLFKDLEPEPNPVGLKSPPLASIPSAERVKPAVATPASSVTTRPNSLIQGASAAVVKTQPSAAQTVKSQPAKTLETKPEAKKTQQPQEVIVLNIMAPAGQRFFGDELLPILMDLQLRFGEMDIFHRHENEDGTGDILFSLANLVKPGTFELSSMAEFETPGLTLFLTLPAGEDSMHAFALMAQAAKRLTQDLKAELKDESRNAMTPQTFEHYKQRVAEFERKRRLAKA